MSESHRFDDMGYCTKCGKRDSDIIAELEATIELQSKLIDWTAEDNAKKAIAIADRDETIDNLRDWAEAKNRFLDEKDATIKALTSADIKMVPSEVAAVMVENKALEEMIVRLYPHLLEGAELAQDVLNINAELEAENKALIDANVEVANINAGLLVEVEALREAAQGVVDDSDFSLKKLPDASDCYGINARKLFALAALMEKADE